MSQILGEGQLRNRELRQSKSARRHGRTPVSCLNVPFVTSNEENRSGLLQLSVFQQRGCIRNTGNMGINYRTTSAVFWEKTWRGALLLRYK